MPGWSRNRRLDAATSMAGHSGNLLSKSPAIQPGFCVFAIDDSWSGLKFVISRNQRTKRPKRSST
jgi:hypothetical protein